MKISEPLRRYWREMLLSLVLAIPWLSLIVLGSVWLWQGRVVWVWSIAVALLGLLAWPTPRWADTGVGVTEDQLKGAPKFNRSTDWDWSDRARDRKVYDYYHTPLWY